MANQPHVWAIGETRLDYWSTEKQHRTKPSFARHIHASQAPKKPIIVHTREGETHDIGFIKSRKAEHGIIHVYGRL